MCRDACPAHEESGIGPGCDNDTVGRADDRRTVEQHDVHRALQ
jgi:hypothetical protein